MKMIDLFHNIDCVKMIEMFFIFVNSFYTFTKAINIKEITLKDFLVYIVSSIITSVLIIDERDRVGKYYALLTLILIMSLINIVKYKHNIIYSIFMTIISLGINHAIYYIALIIAFVPKYIFQYENEYIGLISIVVIYSVLIFRILKMKKVKYGIAFLQNKFQNTYYNVTILNICINVLFLKEFIFNPNNLYAREAMIILIIYIAGIIATLKQSFQLYYQQKLLTKDLEETKVELEAKKQELERLEKENLEFSKTSHSLAHKQKALEFKIEQMMKTNNKDNQNIEKLKEELDDISKEMYKEPQDLELDKTDIPKIDDMLSYMQSECEKNNIKFELQVNGNIHYMVNNLITENELEILIADHIKDAIIAINHSENENRSIMVRIGKIDDVYGLYIYDSGIEFKDEVLEKLGKEPITTHKDEGGTGMGFMNTFDTINRCKASFTIHEICEQSADNYTKVLMFKFDNKNEFKIDRLIKL